MIIDLFKKTLKIFDYVGEKVKRNFFTLIFLSSLAGILDFLGISMMIPLIAKIMSVDPAQNPGVIGVEFTFLTGLSSKLSALMLVSIIVIIFFMKALYNTFFYYTRSIFCFNIQALISEQMALKYLSRQPEIFYGNDSSKYISNCIDETKRFNASVMLPFLALIAEIIVVTLILSLLVYIDWRTSLIVFVLMFSLSLLFTRAMREPLEKAGFSRRHHFRLRLKVFREAIDGFKELSISSGVSLFLKDFIFHNRRGSKADRQANWLSLLPSIWIEFFAVLTIFSAVYFVLNKDSNVTQTLIIIGIFGAASVRLMPSSNRIMNAINTLTYSTSVINLVFEELSKKDSIQEYMPSTIIDCEEGTLLTVNSGEYAYKSSENWSLKIPEMVIRKTEKVAIFGDNGSGKSTLLDLLAGFKSLPDGVMKINLDEPPKFMSDWWKSVSYCSQSVFIFDRDLAFNITLADHNIDFQRLEKVKNIAGLNDVTTKLEFRANKSLGELGRSLSGGERQRIAIARALYKESTVISFFDEVTSNLDEKITHQLVQNLLEWNSDKAMIFVTHDQSLAEYFDTIYSIESGVISREK